MSGVTVDIESGKPVINRQVWQQFTGTIPSGATVVIDTLPRSEFLTLNYKMNFLGQSLDDVKSFSMSVQQFSTNLRDQIYGKTGQLQLSIEAAFNGSNFELSATNAEAFEVEYCLTVLTA